MTGIEEITDLVTDEDPGIVDGREGVVILHPTPEVLGSYRQLRVDMMRERAEALGAPHDLPAATADGVELELMGNIDLPEELRDLAQLGAHGIGLYRSEFLYMETDPRLPTEEDHYLAYRKLVEASAPYPAIVRTYDLGGRKLAREMMESSEENPVLGLRGIRLTLARPQIFRTQLRGLLRAAAHGDPGFDERPREPRPDGPLVVGAVAFEHAAGVTRDVPVFPGSEGARAEGGPRLS